MPVATPRCRGYILAHNHPSAVLDTAYDPYAIIPCPNPPIVPAKISEQCALSNKKRSCKKAVYCEAHLCGACKKAGGVAGNQDTVAKAAKGLNEDGKSDWIGWAA